MYYTRSGALQIYTLLSFLPLLLFCETALARIPTSVKMAVERENTHAESRRWLALPYAFPSDSMGLVFGVGGMVRGCLQDQTLIAATLFGSNDDLEGKDDARGIIGGMWDFRIPGTDRFFLSFTGSAGYYPSKQVYSFPEFRTGNIRPGSNDSSDTQSVKVGGHDDWTDLRLEYVLPLGAAADRPTMTYKLQDGLLVSEPTGGNSWNPLKSGVTNFLLREYSSYEDHELGPLYLERTTHSIQMGVTYDNTDFPNNPSMGSKQFIGVSRDFGWDDNDEKWTFWQVEAAKYFAFGKGRWSKQRVIALNVWTGDTPTWEETALANGMSRISGAPPYNQGATLGGFYRMRAFPLHRFQDKAVIYSTAEYRYTPRTCPLQSIRWLRFLNADLWQFVGFVEGGRVADEYSFTELGKDWKFDAGIGVRLMLGGSIVRLEFATSDECSTGWFMFGHPF